MYGNSARTVMSQRNFTASVVGRLVGMLTSFAGRTIFVKVLDAEFLGIGGFFGNIFALISLAELGFGTAIAQSLYKPLAENDEYKVSAVVGYYTKIYRNVAFATLFLGLCAMPFLPVVVKTKIDMTMLYGAYLLFVLHSFFSYLLAPKCALVVCDQRMYVVTLIRASFSVLSLVIQSAMLVITGNYLLYLASRIMVLTVEDLIINRYADKKYRCLHLKMKVTSEYKKGIYDNVKALMYHKIGGVMSRSTDSLLLTYFVGLSGMGKYSNYALVIGSIGAFFDVAVNAVGASVGNLGAGDRGKKSEVVLRKMYFINFWLLTVGTSVIASTLNPFIELWLGNDMLFTNVEMLIIVTSFYFSCIRDPVQIFVSSYGLFKESRWLPMVRAVVNLVLSVVFVRKMGVSGVFLGTVISTATVPLFGEVYVLYKYGFSMKMKPFAIEMIKYISVSALCVSLSFVLSYFTLGGKLGLLLRFVCGFCTSNALLLMLCPSHEMLDFASKTLAEMMNKIKKKAQGHLW